jgi:hypothetical protein
MSNLEIIIVATITFLFSVILFIFLVEIKKQQKLIRSILNPSVEDRIQRLKTQNLVNQELLSDDKSCELLVEYVITEVTLRKKIEDISNFVVNTKSTEKPNIKEIAAQVQKKDIWNEIKKFWKAHKEDIIKELFGKLNDLVKGFIPVLGQK